MSCMGSSQNTQSLYCPIMSSSRAAGKYVGMETEELYFIKLLVISVSFLKEF